MYFGRPGSTFELSCTSEDEAASGDIVLNEMGFAETIPKPEAVISSALDIIDALLTMPDGFKSVQDENLSDSLSEGWPTTMLSSRNR